MPQKLVRTALCKNLSVWSDARLPAAVVNAAKIFCWLRGPPLSALHQRLQVQHRVPLLGDEVHQLLGIGGDGLVADHVAEILNPQQLLGRGVEPGGHVVLELLGHPDDAG